MGVRFFGPPCICAISDFIAGESASPNILVQLRNTVLKRECTGANHLVLYVYCTTENVGKCC